MNAMRAWRGLVRRVHRLVITVAVALPLGTAWAEPAIDAARSRPADAYAAAAREAARLETQKRPNAAAKALLAVAARYPDDYALHIWLARLLYDAGDFSGALAHYTYVERLSHGAVESRLGMAYSLLQLERCNEARSLFQAVLKAVPENARAAAGIAACRVPSLARANLRVGPTAHIYDNHPTLAGAASVTVTSHVRTARVMVLQATYRHTQFALAQRGRGRRREWTAQHEAHVGVSLSNASVGADLRYGYAGAQGGPLDRTHVVGTILRYSPLGDITLEGSLSLHTGGRVLRLAPAWSLPLGDRFRVRPGLGFQWNDGTALVAPELVLWFLGDRARLFASGRAGRQERPVWLEQPSIYNIADRILEGASAGAQLELGPHWSLDLAYEMQRRKVWLDSGQTEAVSFAHFIVCGLTFSG